MKRCYYILLLLISCLSTIRAEEVVRSGLHCGQIVRITATPDKGYRFVEWSDGESTNPRLIEVTEAMSVEAIFEPICGAKYIVPVVRLYDQILLVDKHSLDSLGYAIIDRDVHWYRIVGDADDIIDSEGNDVLQATGYYINESTIPAGHYYVQINVGKDDDCPETLRSTTFIVSTLGMPNAENHSPTATKFINDSMLFIRRGDNVYNIWGNIVE